ncbi:hypothetical protein CSUI_009272 [Cystoisospora suis]|uniref:Uncharacterized protein n=1 Tax=Cystoisospora suis TaxID=483139 RepID=A0A2C6K4G3_9APIC|nr:hypothetical protein CSUI_009272 [Cystoisospora suis]
MAGSAVLRLGHTAAPRLLRARPFLYTHLPTPCHARGTSGAPDRALQSWLWAGNTSSGSSPAQGYRRVPHFSSCPDLVQLSGQLISRDTECSRYCIDGPGASGASAEHLFLPVTFDSVYRSSLSTSWPCLTWARVVHSTELSGLSPGSGAEAKRGCLVDFCEGSPRQTPKPFHLGPRTDGLRRRPAYTPGGLEVLEGDPCPSDDPAEAGDGDASCRVPLVLPAGGHPEVSEQEVNVPLLLRWRPKKSYKKRTMGLPSTKSRRRWAQLRR